MVTRAEIRSDRPGAVHTDQWKCCLPMRPGKTFRGRVVATCHTGDMRGLTSGLTLGERIAWYRRRRGLSQEVLAGLVGRTVDWLSKVENSRIEIDRVSVIRSLSEALDVSLGDLLNEPSLVEWTSDSGSRTVPAVRAALMDYRQIMRMPASASESEPTRLAELERDLNAVWLAYQDSRFGFVTSRVPQLIAGSQAAAGAYGGDDSARAYAILALTYQAAAVTLTKVGEQDLAWIASDRGLVAAQRSNDAVIQGSLFRSVTHSLLSTGRYNEAVQMTEHATAVLDPHLAKAGGEMLSVYGTLLLAGSMAAARAENRSTTMDFLNLAGELARRLGGDANYLWTAFGPTNVAIHRVSTAMELGDVQLAVETRTAHRHTCVAGRTASTSHIGGRARPQHAQSAGRSSCSRPRSRTDCAGAGPLPLHQSAPRPDLDPPAARQAVLPPDRPCRTPQSGLTASRVGIPHRVDPVSSNQSFKVSQPRVAAGALFHDEAGRVLLVKPTYKQLWDIPGGYVEPGETPRQACVREVAEELGLSRGIGRLLVIDWAPAVGEGDKLLFVFDGGQLDPAELTDVQLQVTELEECRFFRQHDLADVLTDRLHRRITAAIEAHATGATAYLEPHKTASSV